MRLSRSGLLVMIEGWCCQARVLMRSAAELKVPRVSRLYSLSEDRVNRARQERAKLHCNSPAPFLTSSQPTCNRPEIVSFKSGSRVVSQFCSVQKLDAIPSKHHTTFIPFSCKALPHLDLTIQSSDISPSKIGQDVGCNELGYSSPKYVVANPTASLSHVIEARLSGPAAC